MIDKIIHMDWTLILGILFGLSEVLAMIPSIKSSSVFQLIYNVLKSIKDKISPPADQIH